MTLQNAATFDRWGHANGGKSRCRSEGPIVLFIQDAGNVRFQALDLARVVIVIVRDETTGTMEERAQGGEGSIRRFCKKDMSDIKVFRYAFILLLFTP